MLQGKGILTALQETFLAAFSALPDQDQFQLTGGTALAEFYLGHRLSYDLDFFTAQAGLIIPFSYQVEALSASPGWRVQTVRRFSSFVEFLVGREEEELRVDLALDSPFRFEQPLLSHWGIYVNDARDLYVDKLLAYFGRMEPRDAVDLYFILREEPADELFAMAAQKDPGFDPYWLAVALNRASGFPDEAGRWPVRMLVPFDPVKLKRRFLDLAMDLMASTLDTRSQGSSNKS